MKKYEYLSLEHRVRNAELNALGKKGWKLITHTALISAIEKRFAQYYVFRRTIKKEK